MNMLKDVESLSELVVETVAHYDIDGYDWATITWVSCGGGYGSDTGAFIIDGSMLEESIEIERKENECEGCQNFVCEDRTETLSAIEISEGLVDALADEYYELKQITTRVCWE